MLTFGLYFQILQPCCQRSVFKVTTCTAKYIVRVTVRQRSGIFFLGGLLQTSMNHKLKERKERKEKKKPRAPRVRGKIVPVFVVTFPAV